VSENPDDVVDDTDDDLESHWTDFWYEQYKLAWAEGHYIDAYSWAGHAAIEARKQHSSSQDRRDLCHRAFFYIFAAQAAAKADRSNYMLTMYFMSRIALRSANLDTRGIGEGFIFNLRAMTSELDKLKDRVASLGIDPDMNPHTYMKTAMRMDGYSI
jgi:hypothetical protein